MIDTLAEAKDLFNFRAEAGAIVTTPPCPQTIAIVLLLGLLYTEEQEWVLLQVSKVFYKKDPDFFSRWRRLC